MSPEPAFSQTKPAKCNSAIKIEHSRPIYGEASGARRKPRSLIEEGVEVSRAFRYCRTDRNSFPSANPSMGLKRSSFAPTRVLEP